MKAGQPSKTAQRVALRRAAHQVLDNPKVFDDPLALTIAGVDASSIEASGESDADPGSRFIRAFMAVRSRYAEDRLESAIMRGVQQYVVLGAGLDTFAYRNPHSSTKLRVFEVDHPATQAWKQERLVESRIPVPPSVIYCPMDFERETLSDVLRQAGLEMDHPAFFSWLGVTPYLTHSAFHSTLEFISALPPRSEVTFDYAVAPASLHPIERMALEKLAARVSAVGEPFTLFFEPQQLTRELQELCFKEVEDLSSTSINQRYFTGRTDGLQVVGGLAHLVTAGVAE